MGDVKKVNPEIDPSWLALIAGGHNSFQPSTLPMSRAFGWAYFLRSVQEAGQRVPYAHLAERMPAKKVSPDSAVESMGCWQAHIVYPGMMNILDSFRHGTNNVRVRNEI